MNDLISIIVLIKDAESHINLCLESIAKQTYNKIEVLLVNKDSKDNTMKVCKYYEKNDKRFRIININEKSDKNEKNVGIEHSKGKFITFIDAGDRISKDYIEYMYNYVYEEKADIVCTLPYEKGKKNRTSIYYNVYEKEDILSNYFHMNINSSFYGKLYKKSLFSGIKYPEVEYYDDFLTTYKLYEKASKVITSSSNKYCIIKGKNLNMTDEDKIKKIDACLDMLDFVDKKREDLSDECKTKICYEAIDLFRNIKDKTYRKQLYNYIKLYRNYALKDKRFDFNKKSLCIRSILGYNFMRLSFYLEKLYKNI